MNASPGDFFDLFTGAVSVFVFESVFFFRLNEGY
jgi:hypothetical protein